ncbi:FecR family protein [Flavivirga amylovorans]|uniref:FecR family protein n=1 Tax=Flavivirga amylovorans TaxID=870486 RepID=A0ABT8X0P2_9FLAO|nr:FecR family protein [Flavivirga amylovorans]MDO5987521.1 FecR family protein [Flavivirga amylovorans]
MAQNIEKLIVKYLTNSATSTDLDTLSEWVEKRTNRPLFKEYIQTHVAINHNMNEPETKKVIDQFLSRIRKERSLGYKIRKQPIYRYMAAASIAILIAAGLWFTKLGNTTEPQFIEPIIVNNQIQTGTDKATLTLEGGEQIALAKGALFQTQNATSNGEEIIYNDASKSQQPAANSNIAYNYLTIPRGGQFQLTLSDGTQVWLNSESRLKYPVAFNKGETRQVELVYGEAYFDVSPSTEHGGASFKVISPNNQQPTTSNQIIEVLGTEFNIKGYKDETNVYTTLVEGKVTIYAENQNKILAPNQQSNLDTTTNDLSISNVNVKGEIAWVNGEFIIQGKTLKEIIKVLSRWYDMDVTFANRDLEEARFVGILRKDQNIVDILNMIKNFGVINTYEINNKTITLK